MNRAAALGWRQKELETIAFLLGDHPSVEHVSMLRLYGRRTRRFEISGTNKNGETTTNVIYNTVPFEYMRHDDLQPCPLDLSTVEDAKAISIPVKVKPKRPKKKAGGAQEELFGYTGDDKGSED